MSVSSDSNRTGARCARGRFRRMIMGDTEANGDARPARPLDCTAEDRLHRLELGIWNYLAMLGGYCL